MELLDAKHIEAKLCYITQEINSTYIHVHIKLHGTTGSQFVICFIIYNERREVVYGECEVERVCGGESKEVQQGQTLTTSM